MYTDGYILFSSSVYLSAWMAKAIFIDIINLKGLTHSMCLPLLTLDLLFLLCFISPTVHVVMESTVTFQSLGCDIGSSLPADFTTRNILTCPFHCCLSCILPSMGSVMLFEVFCWVGLVLVLPKQTLADFNIV